MFLVVPVPPVRVELLWVAEVPGVSAHSIEWHHNGGLNQRGREGGGVHMRYVPQHHIYVACHSLHVGAASHAMMMLLQ